MKKRLLLGVCLILLFVIGFRILAINQKYPNTVEQYYLLGDTVLYNNFELTVVDSYFLDNESVNKLFKEEIRILGEHECVVVDLKITNRNSKEKTLDVYSFILETGAAKNGVNLNAFYELNVDNATLSPSINTNETISLKLPFHFTEKSFTKNKWENFKNRDFSLTLNLYPQKISIIL